MRLATEKAPKMFSIEGLCRSSGFTHRTTFYVAFKQVTGKSPAEWLAEKRNEQ